MQTSSGLQSCSRLRPCNSLSGQRIVPFPGKQSGGSGRALRLSARALLDPSDLLQHAQTLAAHLPLAYEPVAAPCSLMNCGDVVHRRYASLRVYAVITTAAVRQAAAHAIPTTSPHRAVFVSCSTLDPVLRGEVKGLDWKALALLATAGLYLFATPGGCSPSTQPAPLLQQCTQPCSPQ
jgi:hypothetical protein